MDYGISGKVAVVTGADSGIGLETAKLLLNEGARVVLTDKTAAAVEKAAAQLPAASAARVLAIGADLTKPQHVARLHAQTNRHFGPAAILVHAAGITGPTGGFLDLKDEDWLLAIEVDFMTAVRVCRAFLPDMQGQKWGRVVLFASEDAVQPYIEELPYCAAKAGVLNLAKGLSKAFARDGITVNTVSPAVIATPMTDAMMEKRAKEMGTSFDDALKDFLAKERPTLELQRRGTVEEVASAIAYLCSAQSSFVLGANIRVDGGAVAAIAT